MEYKNKYQQEIKQYSNDGGRTWHNVTPTETRRGRLLEEASDDCNTVEWIEVDGSWFCIDTEIVKRWVTVSGYECVGYDKYTKEQEQESTDGINWTDTQNTRPGTLIERNSTDCGYINYQYRWVNISNDYECDGTTKYNKEKQQRSTDGVNWTDTGVTRKGNIVLEEYSIDCGYIPLYRWVTVSGEYVCVGYDKYAEEKQQISHNNGISWEDVVPAAYRQGDLIEEDSDDCHIYEKYLTTQMLESGVIGIMNEGQDALTNIAYSKNDGEWISISYSQDVSVVAGDIIRWKANGYNERYSDYSTSYSNTYYTHFYSTANYNVYGNPKSLIYRDDFTTITEHGIVSFLKLFMDNTHLISAKRLAMPLNVKKCNSMFQGCTNLTRVPALPATTLVSECYKNMFRDCTSLTTAQSVLPATDVSSYAYQQMFEGCTSLVTAPQISATRLYTGACWCMFYDCTSLVTAPQLSVTTVGNICCKAMFEGCTSLVTAPQILPATTLAENCYEAMFNGCTSLVNPPALPATTLAVGCYEEMFQNCTSLTFAPTLFATTMANLCYYEMFRGCTSLVNAPVLSSTELAPRCYGAMFYGCTSLVNAPQLPATTLAVGCYEEMFRGCTSLTTAPQLPSTDLEGECYRRMFMKCSTLVNAPTLTATTMKYRCYEEMFCLCTSLTTAPDLPALTLVSDCYDSMFSQCSSLNYVKAMFTTRPTTSSTGPGVTYHWLGQVSPTGTFVKNSAATWTNRGSSSIPSGWTIEYASS